MGKAQRSKGIRGERQLVEELLDLDSEAKRVPLSGAMSGYKGDVEALGMKWECKVRKDGSGFKTLYKWLESADALAVKADRKEWLVVLPMSTFKELVGGREGECDV